FPASGTGGSSVSPAVAARGISHSTTGDAAGWCTGWIVSACGAPFRASPASWGVCLAPQYLQKGTPSGSSF
ncbi:hypothetical protein, partial [uncultured Oscillibacter sp.]|uniref:hypothetical protein n=1 Tax=uncultured Oscillibacter sp. TaxID=876091 RepID=UPI0026702E41